MSKLALRFTVAAVLTALLGCEQVENPPQSDSPSPTRTAKADSLDLVVQMTGLMLLVPPNPASSRTDVLMPRSAPAHSALLGIGIADTSIRICGAKRHDGLCYVDLDRWTLEPIGNPGTADGGDDIKVPVRMMNLSVAAGGRYRTNPDRPNADVVRRVTFLSGQLGSDTCSLARWKHRPFSPNGNVMSSRDGGLYNRLSWLIRVPADSLPKLTFVDVRTRTDTVEVPLEGVNGDRIMILLAHVPEAEVGSLPPGTQGTAGKPPNELRHIRYLFPLLRENGTGQPVPPGRYVYPHAPVRTGLARCSATVTRAGKRAAEAPQASAGLSTYSCVIAAGDRHP